MAVTGNERNSWLVARIASGEYTMVRMRDDFYPFINMLPLDEQQQIFDLRTPEAMIRATAEAHGLTPERFDAYVFAFHEQLRWPHNLQEWDAWRERMASHAVGLFGAEWINYQARRNRARR